MADTKEHREEARRRGYRLHPDVHPSQRAQERYPLAEYPCERCETQALPHLIDSGGTEFYWHHQHPELGASNRSGCPRFGWSKHAGARPRPGTATSLFRRPSLERVEWVARTEGEYEAAQEAVEKRGADDGAKRQGL